MLGFQDLFHHLARINIRVSCLNLPNGREQLLALMFEAAGEIDWLTRELACPAPAASPVMSSTYGGNPYPIPAQKPASTAIPPAPVFDTDLREYVRVITQEDIGKHCINVSDGRWLLVEIDRLNKLVADLTAETREELAAMWAAVEPAMFELDHIASADCCCDQSVGVTCVACACQAAVNTIRKWYEAPNPGQPRRTGHDDQAVLEAGKKD